MTLLGVDASTLVPEYPSKNEGELGNPRNTVRLHSRRKPLSIAPIEDSEDIPVKKLTRKQVKEGLEAYPLDVVLLGAVGGKESTLSVKDREFARHLALGESKAEAYRKSRKTTAKPATASRRGQDLAKQSAIQAQAEAFRLAIEAQKLASPAHLRALVIHKLTEHALDDDNKPSERLRALQLLGTVTEVAAFTERREVVQVKDSAQIKERLMQTIRMLTQAGASDVDYTEGDALLAELAAAGDNTIEEGETPPHRHPPEPVETSASTMHSNPHNGSPHLPNVLDPTHSDSEPSDDDK